MAIESQPPYSIFPFWFTIKAIIRDKTTGEPLANTSVTVYSRLKSQTSWGKPMIYQTNSNGVLSFDIPAPPDDAEIKIEHPQDRSIYKIIDIYVPPEIRNFYGGAK